MLLTLSGVLFGCFSLLAGPPTLGEALFGFGSAVFLVLVFLGELIFARSPVYKSNRPRFPAPRNRASKH